MGMRTVRVVVDIVVNDEAHGVENSLVEWAETAVMTGLSDWVADALGEYVCIIKAQEFP